MGRNSLTHLGEEEILAEAVMNDPRLYEQSCKSYEKKN